MQPEQPTPTPYSPQPEPQYTPQPPQQQYAPAPEQLPPHNPGKVMGIIGFVFAFVGLHIPGLILSIIGLAKSKKAGQKNGLALAGIILNSVFMFLTFAFIAVTMISYASIGERANAATAKNTASIVISEALIYATSNRGAYPQSSTDLTSSSAEFAMSPLTTEPYSPYVVALYACGEGEGNAVEYWDYSLDEPAYEFTDDSLTLADCTIAP